MISTEYELLNIAFQASPCLMAITTISDSRYIKINRCFETTTGFSAIEAIGKTPRELELFDDVTRQRVLNIFNEKGSVSNVLLRFRIKDGSYHLGLFSAEPISYNGQKCILSTANDVTLLKKLEEELLKVDRINLVEQIAASIAHEIRNPLTSVRGFLQLYSKQDELKMYNKTFLLMIEELDRANQIISEYLSLSKKESVKKKQSINSLIMKLEPLITTDGLMLDGDTIFDLGDVSELFLNEEEIRQLLLNLTRNAFESMPEGGRIFIKTYNEGSDVVLSIKDHGIGIEKALLHKVGTPFFTTKERGTGLGLTVSDSIAKKHNARINIDSNVDGTEVTVRFNPKITSDDSY